MESKLPEKIEKQIRVDFLTYIKGRDFDRFVRKTLKKPERWWDLWGWFQHLRAPQGIRKVMQVLAVHGEPTVGLVLMRNMKLEDRDAAAPVLIIGSTDVSPKGFRELHQVAFRLEKLKEDRDAKIRKQMGEIFDDETYTLFRSRPVPGCVGSPSHIRLYDELMRGDDFFEWNGGDQSIPIPWAFLFTADVDGSKFSTVVPGKMGIPALRHVADTEGSSPFRAEFPVPKPNFFGLAWRMAAAYAATHLTLAFIMSFAKQPPPFREHLTMITWALPSLVILWLALRVSWPLFKKPWYQKWASFPQLGVFARILPLFIPVMLVSAAVVVGGEKVHASSFWQLITLIGVYIAAFYGQNFLLRQSR